MRAHIRQSGRSLGRKNHKLIATTLDRMRIDRNKADYNDAVLNLTTTAKENLRRANQVIADLSKL